MEESPASRYRVPEERYWRVFSSNVLKGQHQKPPFNATSVVRPIQLAS